MKIGTFFLFFLNVAAPRVDHAVELAFVLTTVGGFKRRPVAVRRALEVLVRHHTDLIANMQAFSWHAYHQQHKPHRLRSACLHLVVENRLLLQRPVIKQVDLSKEDVARAGHQLPHKQMDVDGLSEQLKRPDRRKSSFLRRPYPGRV